MRGAYYNEIDDKAAAWLRELIRRGVIADGVVDTRSIADVQADELAGFTQCHFFAGIGVWSYALRLAGVPDDRPVWTGSCPCPPFSAAGKKQACPSCGGKRNLCHPLKTGYFICLDCGCSRPADDRHLWPEFSRLIQECRPAEVFGEQVASEDGRRWLDVVSADLQNASYGFAGADLCSAGVGVAWGKSQAGEWLRRAIQCCPDPLVARALSDFASWADEDLIDGGWHIRQRLFWVADAGCADVQHWQQRGDNSSEAQRSEAEAQERERCRLDDRIGSSTGGLADDQSVTSGTGLRDCGPEGQRCDEYSDGGSVGGLDHDLGARSAAGLPEPQQRQEGHSGKLDHTSGEWDGGTGSPAAPRTHAPDLGRGAADWLFCRDGNFRPVEPGSFPLAHEAPARVGRLRGYGNAIDPVVAAEFIRTFYEAKAELSGVAA